MATKEQNEEYKDIIRRTLSVIQQKTQALKIAEQLKMDHAELNGYLRALQKTHNIDHDKMYMEVINEGNLPKQDEAS